MIKLLIISKKKKKLWIDTKILETKQKIIFKKKYLNIFYTEMRNGIFRAFFREQKKSHQIDRW